MQVAHEDRAATVVAADGNGPRPQSGKSRPVLRLDIIDHQLVLDVHLDATAPDENLEPEPAVVRHDRLDDRPQPDEAAGLEQVAAGHRRAVRIVDADLEAARRPHVLGREVERNSGPAARFREHFGPQLEVAQFERLAAGHVDDLADAVHRQRALVEFEHLGPAGRLPGVERVALEQRCPIVRGRSMPADHQYRE